jgi:hypothetical protein
MFRLAGLPNVVVFWVLGHHHLEGRNGSPLYESHEPMVCTVELVPRGKMSASGSGQEYRRSGRRL